MKLNFIAGMICILFVSSAAFGQADQVIITSEKVTYQRKGKNVPEYKKTFEVNYPRISGVSAAVKKNIEDSISYWKNFEMTLEENLGDYHWLSSLDYEVAYNKRGVLAIDISIEGVGAYPDGSTKKLVIDLRTGKRVYLSDVFKDIDGLLVLIEKEQKAEIKRDREEFLKRGEKEDAAEFDRQIKSSGLMVNKLEEFSVSDAGVVFTHDYGFPHVVKALEPSGQYIFSWADLRGYIRPDGLLAKFIN
ncbi:MAG: hypothetical protein KDB79_03690 [Acidobacteria bacterium]|nr:hypothetical protein [Acidobacteriota bacterium]